MTEEIKNCEETEDVSEDKFLFPSDYMKDVYGDQWYKLYTYQESVSNKKTKNNNRICWLNIKTKKNDSHEELIIKPVRGVELISKRNKPYRKYILRYED